MQKTSSGILLSATDLSFFMGCNHAAWLDLQQVNGLLKRPPYYDDPTAEALRQKGREFEAAYISELENKGKRILKIAGSGLSAREDTIEGMKAGYDVICQASLHHSVWQGLADFLVKVDRPSMFGHWSYEVEDTKFARETKSGAILQICLYSWMLTELQGVAPEKMYIKTPVAREEYRVSEYMAFFRLMQKKLLQAIGHTSETTYPHPVDQCEICRWWQLCNERRRNDDHLAFIAGMGASQVKQVKEWNVDTLKAFAEMPLPLPHEPRRGSAGTYTRLREQARVQLQAREEKKNIYELLDLNTDTGLFTLPAPSAGDMFFDFEGDPFVGETGREYLFGWVHNRDYKFLWALNDADEKKAFEAFIDMVMHIREKHPDMHIYHFAPYEPSAIKRLMGKYATREEEVDTLLRGNVFIDLHTVTKHTLRAGIETYSLKSLERFHEFNRKQELEALKKYKARFEGLLETDNADAIDDETKDVVRDYNMDDCLSAESLRNWLEEIRATLIKQGNNIPRPEFKAGDQPDSLKEFKKRIQPVYDKLMEGVSSERHERSDEEQARWLLANMLIWYKREDKSFWWEYFTLLGMDDEDLVYQKSAISGLHFNGTTGADKRSLVHYYTFPEQDTEIRTGKNIQYKEDKIGSVFSIDFNKRIIGIKKSKKFENFHPTHIILKDYIDAGVKQEAIIRIADWIAYENKNAVAGPGRYQTACDLLLRKFPGTILPIQGPPGTGKSHKAAEMILQSIQQGKKIGITALGHQVISGLLSKIAKAASGKNIQISIIQKNDSSSSASWRITDSYDDIHDAIDSGVNIIAGTPFMWAREDFENTVDELYVDEAGQLSLIDTIALSHAAKQLVLLGDPQQLQQPQKGQHPEGTEVSALAHILGIAQTINTAHGIFLDKTWRLHPNICEYISELFYESRLHTKDENANQLIIGNTKYHTPGVYVETVLHTGNSNKSMEEVHLVHQIVTELLSNKIEYRDRDGHIAALTAANIKIIAPYNAQVNALRHTIPQIEIGTVDKFQGQEAEIVIFSMATSSPEDAPRGMEFLYSLNRLNVAVSRAKTIFILVASPLLFEPNCRSPRHMKLANALCRLVELSKL